MMLGYCTISMNKIDRDYIVEKSDRVPIRLIEYPTALIGRLAVDNRQRKKGIGSFICKWAIGYCVSLSEKIGCRYIVLQTDEAHRGWYEEKLGFKVFNVKLNRHGNIDYWLYHKLDFE